MRRSLVLVSFLFLALVSFGLSKKKKEEVTQTLAIPRELPSATIALTRNLQFQNSTLIPHGLLSSQTRDAVHELLRLTSGMQIVEIRAFVAGTGDLRRVPQIVSETFTEKKHSVLPAVTVVQVGGLATEGAQVALEAISESKKQTNPHGLLFTKAIERSINRPYEPLAPLAKESLHEIETLLAGRGHALRVTCFASAPEDASAIRSFMSTVFPGAALTLLQTVRTPSRSSVACEAIARADGEAISPTPEIALLDSERIVFTGTQVAFGVGENDARLAFRRLERVLSGVNAPLRTASLLRLYPLSPSIGAQAARLSKEFVDPKHPPLTSVVQFEGLPGLDSTFAVEAIAPAASSSSRPSVGSSAMLNQ